MAAAYGAPPDWVDDIPGSEAWAVKEAAIGALPGCVLRVDCQPCVDAFKAGLEWATGDKRKHARVRTLMLQAWDDFDPEGIVWMPAHTTEASVGVAELGDGTKLTALDRRGNAHADRLAKQGASTHRVPESIRNRLKQQRQLVKKTVQWIGLASHEANNQTEPPHRDTTANKAATRRAKKERAQARAAALAARALEPKRPVRIAARPWELGGHAIDASQQGGWRCRVCRTHAAKWNDIASKRCKGSAAAAWAQAAAALSESGRQLGANHHRMLSGDTIWCFKCGAYGGGRAIALRQP